MVYNNKFYLFLKSELYSLNLNPNNGAVLFKVENK